MAVDPSAGPAPRPRSARLHRPFQGVSRQGWWNLGFVAAGLLLAAYCALSIRSREFFEYWGADFRAFRVPAEVRSGVQAMPQCMTWWHKTGRKGNVC